MTNEVGRRSTRKALGSGLLVLGLCAVMMPTSAAAANVTPQPTLYSTATGVSAWNFDDGNGWSYRTGVKVKDAKADDRSVYVQFQGDGIAGLDPVMTMHNTGGYGSTKSSGAQPGTYIVKHRGVTKVPILKDVYGAWRYPAHD